MQSKTMFGDGRCNQTQKKIVHLENELVIIFSFLLAVLRAGLQGARHVVSADALQPEVHCKIIGRHCQKTFYIDILLV